ncbi:chlorophyll synthesis pathway protein BchC [Halovulum dunhuangense]|uniref:Chlorophyll synthesis pathway protein BchC n=1 Tax=Halovulum dunhuangense TaxID=1505036 RepID=A0A849KYM3_9RHOB|nr:chlorophyll synthesis pathway protein BchC [Halovulum dunhuangense]NNU79346.1 chlorophyll synthesis pathway protein BchC [Halovulum dunhuangense]
MDTQAVLMRAPRSLSLESLRLRQPKVDEVVVEVLHSGISTGTEKLFWTGRMPDFPGMGYPLVPGYESVGEVVEAGALAALRPGTRVFVPGADCYEGARGLFGGASASIITAADRLVPVDPALGEASALIALAATARHAIAGMTTALPELIVGHGVMGRLLARLTIAAGGRAPTVWELDPARRLGEFAYPVLHPDDDCRMDYATIYDASGDAGGLNGLIRRLAKGGEIVLAGFYAEPLSFAFPPAFMKEARLRIAAEWNRQDMLATKMLIEEGHLSLDGLVTHRAAAGDAAQAYVTAFEDPACLKMILNWKASA